MRKSAPLLLLILIFVQDSLSSRCWPSSSLSSSVLLPLSLGPSSQMLRVPGVSSLSRCVDAACDSPFADVAWLFQGRCYVLSCQQRALCRPQRRPGAQSHVTFIQRSGPLLPPLYWGDYKSAEAPGDLQTLKDLGLLGSKPDYEEPDVLLDYPQSNEETDQSQLKDRHELDQSPEAENETTPTAEKHADDDTTQNASVSSAPPTTDSPNHKQEMTSLPVPAAMTSLPVVDGNLTFPTLASPGVKKQATSVSLGITAETKIPDKNTTSAKSLQTTAPTTVLVPPTAPPTVLAPPTASPTVPAPPTAPPSAAVCPSPPAPVASVSPGQSSSVLGPAPVAHAGGSHTLILPNSSLLLQGSVTNADPKTVHFTWTRDAQSPAAGDVLFDSQSGSSLILVNLVEGSYLFHLRVTDAWGRSASATATVQVLQPGGGDEVELELQVSVSQVSVSQKNTLLSQLSALLHVSTSDVQLRGIYGHARLSTVLRFLVRSPSGPVPGPSWSLCSVCQLQCSGRGQCDPVSRLCLCDPFWTENLLRTYLGDGQSNCEWRVLYVILSGFILVLVILSAVWTFMCCCRRKRQSRVRRKTRYTILDNVDEQERVELRPRFSLKHRSTEHNSSLMMSESELSDQDFSREPLRSRNRTKNSLNQA
ncbi:hypothetical protein WMY93_026357 [Mugilogobius chulae]|uniref:PKD/Chitinase domain-containing protein n=1 Tax=Mugilogobius chulae TaxID=88201 RepID=A0AAW0N7H2_9GOBI